MKVILDTCILRQDFLLRSESFHLFKLLSKQLDFRVYLPEVIFLELKRLYSQELRERVQVYLTSHNKLSSLLVCEHECYSELAEEIGKDVDKYIEDKTEAYLQMLLIELDCRQNVVDIPEHSHRRILEKIHLRKKPFSNKDTGYKDELIWKTILQLALDGEKIAFITSNKSDFLTESTELHPDLVEELKSIRIKKKNVIVYDTFKEFVTQEVLPKDPDSLQMLKLLQTRNVPEFNIESNTIQWVHQYLKDKVIPAKALTVPYKHLLDLVAVYKIREVKVNTLRIRSVSKHPNKDIKHFIVDYDADVDCQVVFDVSKEQYRNLLANYSLSAPAEFSDFEEKGTVEIPQKLSLNFYIELHQKTHKVKSKEISVYAGQNLYSIHPHYMQEFEFFSWRFYP